MWKPDKTQTVLYYVESAQEDYPLTHNLYFTVDKVSEQGKV